MSSNLTRRGLIGLVGASAGLASCAGPTPLAGRNDGAPIQGIFAHGVASGDPFTDSVVLWTHLSVETEGDVDVSWEISTQPDMAETVAIGTATTNAARDYCVKVVPEGLSPGTAYFYRFKSGDTTSPIGRTKTLPIDKVERLRFAVASCANWQHGYFNTYDAIAKRAEADPYDAMIHLGDYFYEYGALEKTRLQDRIHVPPQETLKLSDYRQRHAQYRSDPALQAASAAMPLIAVWDDHESSNDSWTSGAENHQPAQEGPWEARKQAALRAYYEWMPIREPQAGRVRTQIYRDFRFGDLAHLVCVETRLTARAEPIIIEEYTEQINSVEDAENFKRDVLNDPTREMFGADQQSFILDSLSASKQAGVPWRLLANQVIMARLLTPDFTPYIDEAAIERIEPDWSGVRDFLKLSQYKMPVYPDSWDGYPVARDKFFGALDQAGINDLLVLTGDAHEFWLNELTHTSGTKVGMEVVTSSVSSETLTAYLGDATADHNLLLTQENSDARYYNAMTNGFVDLTLTPKSATVKMIGVSTVLDRDYESVEVAQFTLRPNGETIKAKTPKGLTFTQRVLYHGRG